MTLMVDARAMQWAERRSTLYSLEIDGWQYLTDHYVMLPTARVGGLPVGYGNLLMPLARQAEEGLAMWLSANVLPEPSTRVFERIRIDPVEGAGFKVRPLERVREAHGICDPQLRLVGLIVPLRRRMEEAAAAGTIRTAAA